MIASSPIIEQDVHLPVVPQLKNTPRALPSRVSAMLKVLVRMFFLTWTLLGRTDSALG